MDESQGELKEITPSPVRKGLLEVTSTPSTHETMRNKHVTEAISEAITAFAKVSKPTGENIFIRCKR